MPSRWHQIAETVRFGQAEFRSGAITAALALPTLFLVPEPVPQELLGLAIAATWTGYQVRRQLLCARSRLPIAASRMGIEYERREAGTKVRLSRWGRYRVNTMTTRVSSGRLRYFGDRDLQTLAEPLGRGYDVVVTPAGEPGYHLIDFELHAPVLRGCEIELGFVMNLDEPLGIDAPFITADMSGLNIDPTGEVVLTHSFDPSSQPDLEQFEALGYTSRASFQARQEEPQQLTRSIVRPDGGRVQVTMKARSTPFVFFGDKRRLPGAVAAR